MMLSMGRGATAAASAPWVVKVGRRRSRVPPRRALHRLELKAGLFDAFSTLMGGPIRVEEWPVDQASWRSIKDMKEGEPATFGAGCYWGTEKFYARDFEAKHPGSILASAVGFMSPDPNAVANPTYTAVCTGMTSHVEVVHLRFNPEVASYEDLCRFLFTFHDPTTLNQQGNDRGTQYASVIFAHSEAQLETANKVKEEVQALLSAGKLAGAGFRGKEVTTQVVKANEYFNATRDHQRYLELQPGGYCNHRERFSWDQVSP